MVRFYQLQPVVLGRYAARRRLARLPLFSRRWSLSGIGLFALATIFLFGPGRPGSGVIVTAVAAEGKVSDRLRLSQVVPQRDRCLSRQEQRARVAAHAAIPLGKAVRVVKGRGDLLRARLCERRGKLLYLVTILGRSGKVQRFAIDAKSGKLVGSRH